MGDAGGLRAALERLAASYDRRLGRPPRPTAGDVVGLCAAEVRAAVLTPVLGVAAANPDMPDRRLAHVLRSLLGRRRAAPPPLPPGAAPEELARRDAAWTREVARVRGALRETGV